MVERYVIIAGYHRKVKSLEIMRMKWERSHHFPIIFPSLSYHFPITFPPFFSFPSASPRPCVLYQLGASWGPVWTSFVGFFPGEWEDNHLVNMVSQETFSKDSRHVRVKSICYPNGWIAYHTWFLSHPLVNVYITMEHHHFLMWKLTISMAMASFLMGTSTINGHFPKHS